MSEIKAILFDADGVLTLPEEMFSVMYSKSRGLDPEPFENFFKTEWQDFVIGNRDLKRIFVKIQISGNGTIRQRLLEFWFKSEDIRNDEMIELVEQIRQSSTPCYLATEQEKYRGEYMKNVMFKDHFDEYFVTADLGPKRAILDFSKKLLKYLIKTG